MKILLEMDRVRAKYLLEACLIMAAMGRGEFIGMFNLLRPGAAFMETNKAVWDEQDWLKVEALLKAKLSPSKKRGAFKTPAECLESECAALFIEKFLTDYPKEDVLIELDHDEGCRLMRACEIMARIGMGQFKDLIGLFNPKLDWDEQVVIENDLKEKLYPGIGSAYHAMHSDKCPEECKVAWDCYQHIRREIAWFGVGKDWRKDERSSNGSGISQSLRIHMGGVSFDEPFKVSKLKGDFRVNHEA